MYVIFEVFLIYHRITPLFPNWFLNIACPVVNVPLKTFFFATLFGLMPANIIQLKTGLLMKDAT